MNLQNGFSPPDWLVLLHAVVKRISTGDENESALLFKLLGTIIVGGQEKALTHIPEIVSNIANTIAKLLPPAPDPWPQVLCIYLLCGQYLYVVQKHVLIAYVIV